MPRLKEVRALRIHTRIEETMVISNFLMTLLGALGGLPAVLIANTSYSIMKLVITTEMDYLFR